MRQAIKLAIDAVRWELRQWAEPTPAGAPAQPVRTSCTSPFLDRVRADVHCPFCAGPKTPGDLQCASCADVRSRIAGRTKGKA